MSLPYCMSRCFRITSKIFIAIGPMYFHHSKLPPDNMICLLDELWELLIPVGPQSFCAIRLSINTSVERLEAGREQ